MVLPSVSDMVLVIVRMQEIMFITSVMATVTAMFTTTITPTMIRWG